MLYVSSIAEQQQNLKKSYINMILSLPPLSLSGRQ